jgi:four helix bundle protein
VILNIAEAYPMAGADRARRFRIAGGEAAECHAGLDLLEIRGELCGEVLRELRALLDRTRAMLWRLSRP